MGKKVTKKTADKKPVVKTEVVEVAAVPVDGWTSPIDSNHPDGVPPNWTGHLGS